MQSLDGRHVLVTGANGGLGEQFVAQGLERGAAKVYAAARSTRDWNDPLVVPLDLDLTDPDAPARAVAAAPDVDVLINNARHRARGRHDHGSGVGSATRSRRCSPPTAAAPC